MISLDSPRWAELEHAYGRAGDIPALLRQLESLPPSSGNSEPWFTLWSALAHQGDVYSASFAAVPHVVAAFGSAPARADETYLQFPAWVDICRSKHKIDVPPDLAPAYLEALARLPELVAAASHRTWSSGFLACALSAVAAAKGAPAVAEAALELSPEIAEKFLEWFFQQ